MTKTNCCARPDPRILATNGRLFCKNCRKYLDTGRAPVGGTPDTVVRDAPPKREPGGGTPPRK